MEKEYDLNPLSESFLVRHDELDTEISEEKRRVKLVKRSFIVLDIVALISLWAILYSTSLSISYREGIAMNNFIKNVGIQAIVAALMVFSAYHITKFLKKKTNQKPNSCLLYWHIVNLSFLLISSVVIFVIEENQLDLK